MRYSPLVERIAGRGAAAWDTHIAARRRQEEGEDIIFLTVGDPDQDPPHAVIEATIAALRAGRTGYSGIVGFPALREAIAARVARRSLLPCGIDNVAVVPGAQGGLFCAVQCLAGPGDEIIVPEPVYATYEGVVGASGATLVTAPLRSTVLPERPAGTACRRGRGASVERPSTSVSRCLSESVGYRFSGLFCRGSARRRHSQEGDETTGARRFSFRPVRRFGR